VLIKPTDGCDNIENGEDLNNSIVLVKRGHCVYIEKALIVEKYGGVAMVVGNDEGDILYQMAAKNDENISFPCVFVAESTYNEALYALETNPPGTVIGTISTEGNISLSNQ